MVAALAGGVSCQQAARLPVSEDQWILLGVALWPWMQQIRTFLLLLGKLGSRTRSPRKANTASRGWAGLCWVGAMGKEGMITDHGRRLSGPHAGPVERISGRENEHQQSVPFTQRPGEWGAAPRPSVASLVRGLNAAFPCVLLPSRGQLQNRNDRLRLVSRVANAARPQGRSPFKRGVRQPRSRPGSSRRESMLRTFFQQTSRLQHGCTK